MPEIINTGPSVEGPLSTDGETKEGRQADEIRAIEESPGEKLPRNHRQPLK